MNGYLSSAVHEVVLDFFMVEMETVYDYTWDYPPVNIDKSLSRALEEAWNEMYPLKSILI